MRFVIVALTAVLAAVPVAAQIDPSADYRTLHTEHFRIHFQPEHRWLAQRAAREAERAYRLMSRELKPPRGAVEMVLTDAFDFPNAQASVWPSNRLTIQLPPPVAGSLTDFDDWLRLVITHELTHIFHLDRADGPWRVLQTVFGRAPGLFPNAYQPSWVVEGLATYYESRWSDAGRVASSYHRQIVRGDRLYGVHRRPNDATFVNIQWPSGNAAYAYGGQLFDFFSQTAGDSSITAFVNATSRQFVPFPVGRHVRHSAGRSLDRVWEETVRAFDGGPARGGNGGAGERVIADGLLLPPNARLSPDGLQLAYVRDDGVTPRHVIVLDLRSGSKMASHLVNGAAELAWDGESLLISQFDWTGAYQLRRDIYRWTPVRAGEWKRLTRGRRLTAPEAAGGLVTAIRMGAGLRYPVLLKADGTVERLPVPVADAVWGRAVPAPRGRWIAGLRHHEGQWDVVVWPVAAPTEARRVTDDPAVEADLSWGPMGRLLYVSDATSLPQVYRWDPSDGTRVQLSAARNGARGPQLTSDGRLYYVTIGQHGHRIEMVRLTLPVREPSLPRLGIALEPAEPVTIRETGYAGWPSLLPRYWLPYGRFTGAGGEFLGALTSAVDVLERTGYTAAAAVDVGRGRWIGFVTVTDARLGRPVLDFGVAQDWTSALIGPDEIAVRERNVMLGASWFWRRWRHAVSVRVGAVYERNDYDPARLESSDFLGGTIALGVTRTNTASLAISRERGFSAFLFGRRRQRLDRRGWSNEGRVRLTVFLPTPIARHVLAGRFVYGQTGGPDRARFSVGGTSGGVLPIVPGYSLGTSRSFPVRGYPARVARGTTATVGTLEYRVPLVYVGRGVASFPFGLTRILGAVFGDWGGAWDSGAPRRPNALLSAGAELALDVTTAYDVPLRVRFGAAARLRAFRDVESGTLAAYAAFGLDF